MATLSVSANYTADGKATSAVEVDGQLVTPVMINGGISEYLWLDTDTPPTLGANDRAFGIEINTTTHKMSTQYWTGSAWQGVE
jgi:hypothetical protein